jgi:type I restriction enzyme S subunit
MQVNTGLANLSDKAYEVRELYEPDTKDNLPYIGLEHIEQQALKLNGLGLSSTTISTKKVFKNGDILFGSLRPYFRKVYIPKFDGVCSTDITVIRAKENTDQIFLFYLIASRDFIDYATSITSGTRMPRANWKVLSNSKWSFPPFPTQRKIAAILSVYDDLIENNNQRIKLLEEMARLIYREWFVDFRFPGHENVKMVDSPLGRIPEGWEVKSFLEIIDYHIGGGWGKEESRKGFEHPAYVIRGTDIPNARNNSTPNVALRFHSESNLKNRVLKHNDIVFEVSGGSKEQPVGRALLVHQCLLDKFTKPVMCASFCKLLRTDNSKILPEIIYLHLEEIYDNRSIMQYQVQSTGITNFKFQQFLENEMIVIPSLFTQNKFKEIVEPIYTGIQLLGLKNKNLRQTRDLLLPKLISGELDVSEMDIEIPEDAA